MSVIISCWLSGDRFKAFLDRLPSGYIERLGWFNALPQRLNVAGLPHVRDNVSMFKGIWLSRISRANLGYFTFI